MEYKFDIQTVVAIAEFLILVVGSLIFRQIYKHNKESQIDAETKYNNMSKELKETITNLTETLGNEIVKMSKNIDTIITQTTQFTINIAGHTKDISKAIEDIEEIDEELKLFQKSTESKISDINIRIENSEHRVNQKIEHVSNELHQKINQLAIDHARNHK